ncbi:MAG TPA: hypothetical protein VG722_07755, partial [Tepidisphaeraceae bacterium]|nr:hypothetical protein [Tepidisphaeraceae bacterium]
FLLMKGAKPHIIFAAPLETDGLSDQLDDVGGTQNQSFSVSTSSGWPVRCTIHRSAFSCDGDAGTQTRHHPPAGY